MPLEIKHERDQQESEVSQHEPAIRRERSETRPQPKLMDQLKLDGWCEKAILGLVIAILTFSVLATGCVRPQDFVVIQWLTVSLLALWWCRFWLNPKHRLLWS